MKKWLGIGFLCSALAAILLVAQPPDMTGVSLPTANQLLEGPQLEVLAGAESTEKFFQETLMALPIDVLAILLVLLVTGIVINFIKTIPDRTVAPQIRPFWAGLAGAFFWLSTGFAGGIWLSGILFEWNFSGFGIHWITGFYLQLTFLVSVLVLLFLIFLKSIPQNEILFLNNRGTKSALWTGIVEYLRFYPYLVLALVINELLVLPYTAAEFPLSYRFLGSAQNSFQNVILYGLIGLLAPITEELFFRGIVFGSLRSTMSLGPSTLLAGGIFGFVHFECQLVLLLWLFGSLLCYTYERTGSIKVVIVMHFLQNTVSFYMIKRLFA